MKIICIGEALIDFTPYKKAGTYIRNFGGAPANVAVIASRLGGKTEFIGKIGKDQFGIYIQNFFEKENVSIKRIVTEQANTTLSFVHLDGNGNRSFEFIRNPGADMFLEEKDIENDFCTQNDIVHFGSAQLMLENGKEAIKKAVIIAQEAGAIVSFDPNYRAPQWENEILARNTILEYMKLADIIKISDEEAMWLAEDTDEKEAVRKLKKECGKLIVMTCGSKGAYYIEKNKLGFVPGYVQEAVDTTGAGDAFWGTFLRLLSEKIEREERLAEKDLREIIKYANAAGALCVREKGAITASLTWKKIQKICRECTILGAND